MDSSRPLTLVLVGLRRGRSDERWMQRKIARFALVCQPSTSVKGMRLRRRSLSYHLYIASGWLGALDVV